jgi:hydrogenase nickel incorporation protein HypA/HybF
MHEMSIAQGLIEQIRRLAREHRAEAVERVELRVGVLRLVVPEALVMAFEEVARGSLAEGAELEILEQPARARCRGCGSEYAPDPQHFDCPACGRAEPEILEGDEILLTGLTCRTDEPAETPAKPGETP